MAIPPCHRRSRSSDRRRSGSLFSSRVLPAGAILLLALALAQPGLAASPEDIAGVWLTDDARAAIEIRPCGAERCGYVVWMGSPKSAEGEPSTDRNNPDPARRSHTICGLQIISGLKPQADGSWGQGRVYNPKTGKTYGMKIRREAPDAVKATGYLGLELLGQSMEWRRAPNDLGRCQGANPRR
jgi:uncharacterized protein (DUF2147 family)